jgi:hypothetical protein
MRFEVEVQLADKVYTYGIAFEFPERFRELRVAEEKLLVDGQPIFTRELAQVRLARAGRELGANFRIDWHLVVALPIVQPIAQDDPTYIFKQWLANSLILRPVPSLAEGGSESGSLQLNTQVTNIGEWFTGLLTSAPASYMKIDTYLKQVMPDLQDIKNR